jgi:DNA invertase Pin-like site-specific DNA recombinase
LLVKTLVKTKWSNPPHTIGFDQGRFFMLVGYARVSTLDQSLDLQSDALIAAGVDAENIFSDLGVSGSQSSRTGLDSCLRALRSGDQLVVWRLDRLGRSTSHLLKTVEDLGVRGIEFKSLQESFDTSTPGGKMIFTILGALAEMERSLIRDRVNAGLAAARARGKLGGRKRMLNNQQRKNVVAMIAGGASLSETASTFGVSISTIQRVVRSTNQVQ